MNPENDLDNKLRKIIQEKFEFYRMRNSRLSLRSFAKTLDISPSALSEYIGGKRSFSKTVARKILGNLDSNEYNNHFDLNLGSKKFKAIKKAEVFLVKDWVYFAVLSLSETEDFKSDPHWIGQRLNVDPSKIKNTLNDLLRLNLLKESSGNLVPTNDELFSSDEVKNDHLWHRYVTDFELAKLSLKEDNLALRDFSFMTISIDPDDMKKYKRCIRKMQDEICKISDKGKKKEVYEFCFQVFPLSHKPTIKDQED